MKSGIDHLLDQVDWIECDPQSDLGGLPFATHSGIFTFGDVELRCYRLNDGRAIFDADDFRTMLQGCGLL